MSTDVLQPHYGWSMHQASALLLVPDKVDFAKYLLQLSNGTTPVHPEIGEDMVKIPQEYLVDTTDELIDKVFPELENGYMDKYFVSHRAILTPLNDNVDKINEV